MFKEYSAMSIDSFVGAISSYVDAFVVTSFKNTNTLTNLYAIKISGITLHATDCNWA